MWFLYLTLRLMHATAVNVLMRPEGIECWIVCLRTRHAKINIKHIIIYQYERQ